MSLSQFEHWYLFKAPRCLYCSAKAETIVIASRRCAENLHENPDKGHGGEGTGLGEVKEPSAWSLIGLGKG